MPDMQAIRQLKAGVVAAISLLGQGVMKQPDNTALRAALHHGTLDAQSLLDQLVRWVFRMLFMGIAEARGLVPGSLAEDFWHKRTQLTGPGCEAKANVPAWDCLLEQDSSDLNLDCIPKPCWEQALQSLGFPVKGLGPGQLAWAQLGAEALGHVYEELLAHHAVVAPLEGQFELKEAAGNVRKTSGSYYTPASLIEKVLDESLDAAMDEALAKAAGQGIEAQAQSLLALKLCDPACGGGHFLLAAGRRLAKSLAVVRSGQTDPSPEACRMAFSEVAQACLYGVDLNPMAVALTKFSLWMEAPSPGHGIGLLAAHIQVGNALMGSTPALLAQGIPNAAWKALSGDEAAKARHLSKANRQERKDWQGASPNGLDWAQNHDAFKAWCDAWCAAWAWPKGKGAPAVAPTHGNWIQALARPEALDGAWEEVARLAKIHRFFHWHLAFPELFKANEKANEATPEGEPHRPAWTGGFDVVLGNPPWERVKLQRIEFFSQHDMAVAKAGTAAERNARIAALEASHSPLFARFQKAETQAEVQAHFIAHSGRFPLGGRGDVNTYAAFTDLVLGLGRRVGLVVPSGVASDASTAPLFRHLVAARRLCALLDFENRNAIFKGVHRSTKFCVLALGPAGESEAAKFSFFATDVAQLPPAHQRIHLKPELLLKFNPNTGSCPVFRSQADAKLAVKLYDRFEVLMREGERPTNPWGLRLGSMFHMANDSHLFKKAAELLALGYRLAGNAFIHPKLPPYLPLYEGKMIHQFNHRWASAEAALASSCLPGQGRGPEEEVLPRYWVPQAEVHQALKYWEKAWLLAWRTIARPTDERSWLSSIVPAVGLGHSLSISTGKHDASRSGLLCALWNSLLGEYLLCQKLGGSNLCFFHIKQLPMPKPEDFLAPQAFTQGQSLQDWVLRRVLHLTYTSHSLAPWARELGYAGPPFAWSELERARMRAELDAAIAIVYGLKEGELRHVLDSFSVLRSKEEKAFGHHRTADLVLEAYGAMSE